MVAGAMKGEFNVYQYFRDGSEEQVLRYVDAGTAVGQAKRLTTSIGGRFGTTVRIIITDGEDMTNFVWEYGKGVTYPPQASVMRAASVGYWMHETSGMLRPAVEAYLNHDELTPQQIAALRAYIRQWIAAPEWEGPMIDTLRTMVDELHSREAIDRWVEIAIGEMIDPF